VRAATQHLGFQFKAVANADAGCAQSASGTSQKATWKFGSKTCERPNGMAATELYRLKVN